MLVGKPLNLFEMLSMWETKLNTASATDHLSSLFDLSIPACAGAAGFLSSFLSYSFRDCLNQSI